MTAITRQRTASFYEAPHVTLADLYTLLHNVNEQLKVSTQAVPLTTSKFGNVLSGMSTLKARQEAASRKHHLESEQRSLRATIRARSGSGVRNLHIYDLPEEILCQVFGYLRGSSYVEEASSVGNICYATKDIKNARLACPRFYGATSHLLLSSVRLDISPESVARIDDISQHQLVRKGVCAIKIRMNIYSQGLAESFEAFVSYNILKLQKELRRLEGLREWNNVEKDVKKANLIIDAWERLVADTPRPHYIGDERYLPYQQILKEAHTEYRLRRRQQRDMLENDDYVKSVRTAIARMPRVKGLQLCGGSWFDDVRINFGILRSDAVLRQALLLPMACQEDLLLQDHEQPLTNIASLLGSPEAPAEEQALPPHATNPTKGQRRQLQRLTLSNLAISLVQLNQVLRYLTASSAQVMLKSVRLSTDTWEEVLDLLRRYPNCRWCLDSPTGAECDDLSNEEIRSIFGTPRSRSVDGLSLAERYIAGLPGYTNPFRVEMPDIGEW